MAAHGLFGHVYMFLFNPSSAKLLIISETGLHLSVPIYIHLNPLFFYKSHLSDGGKTYENFPSHNFPLSDVSGSAF